MRWRVIYEVVAGFHAWGARRLNEITSIDPSRVETIDQVQFHPDISMYLHRKVGLSKGALDMKAVTVAVVTN